MDEIEISPTCVPETLEELNECARSISSFAERLHLDIDDGRFTPAHTWPYTDQGTIGPLTLRGVKGLDVDVHLMVEEPREVGLRFVEEGARRIIAHVEAFSNADEVRGALDLWRMHQAQVGLAILLETPLEVLEPNIAHCDFVHIMTIASIGSQGIPYDPRGIERIRSVHANFPELPISVDGGVSLKNIADLVRAGARRFGIGSAIMKAGDPISAYHSLKTLAESALQ